MIRILWFLAGVGATALLTTDTGRRVADELGNAATNGVRSGGKRLMDDIAPKVEPTAQAKKKERDDA